MPLTMAMMMLPMPLMMAMIVRPMVRKQDWIWQGRLVGLWEWLRFWGEVWAYARDDGAHFEGWGCFVV
jgi:hypothetical protein